MFFIDRRYKFMSMEKNLRWRKWRNEENFFFQWWKISNDGGHVDYITLKGTIEADLVSNCDYHFYNSKLILIATRRYLEQNYAITSY